MTKKKHVSKKVTIRLRDLKTGKLVSKPHSQKYLRPEIYEGNKRVTTIGNFRQGVNKDNLWKLNQLYNSPSIQMVSETHLKISQPASVHQTLLNNKELFKGASFADVIIKYGKNTFKLNKVPLRETGTTIFDRYNFHEGDDGRQIHDKKNASELDLLRMAIKRELENNGYAITPKNIRLEAGDRKTRAHARGTKVIGKNKDGSKKYAKGKQLKTIKPFIIVRIYK